MATTMLAAVTDGKGTLSIQELPMPAFGDYEALVKLRFGATCAGTDLGIIDGRHPFPLAYPAVLGHESVGEVLEIGKKVRSLKAGDLVARVGAPAAPGTGRRFGLGRASPNTASRSIGRR